MKLLLNFLGPLMFVFLACGGNVDGEFKDSPVHSPADEIPVAQPAATTKDVQATAGTESEQEIRTPEAGDERPANKKNNKSETDNFADDKQQSTAPNTDSKKEQKPSASPTDRKKETTENAKKRRKKGRAKVAFQETVHEFGVIAQGEKIEHSFEFENVGSADLEILNVDVTCGCTIPTFPFIPIAPGEKGKITVSYNSTGKLGNQKPMITVITNASPRTYKLYFKGVVDAERAKLPSEGAEKN